MFRHNSQNPCQIVQAFHIITISSLLIAILLSVACGGGNATSSPPPPPPPPVLAISRLEPSSAMAAPWAPLSLTVHGSAFLATSVVRWNGSNRSTKFISNSELSTTITAEDLAAPGSASVTVFDSSGAISNSIEFLINVFPGQANGSSDKPKISATGRFVVFDSLADNLVKNDTNGVQDVFVRDTCIGAPPGCIPTTFLVSVSTEGEQANAASMNTGISDNGRFVTFVSEASNLVISDQNGVKDVFLRDTCLGAPTGCNPSTIRVSIGNSGVEGNGSSDGGSVDLDWRYAGGSVSRDGRYVVFNSTASNLVSNDPNGSTLDSFIRDTCLGAAGICVPSTILVSADDSLAPPLFDRYISLSANGRYMAFHAYSQILGKVSMWRDTCNGKSTDCVPKTVPIAFDPNSFSHLDRISSDGRFVSFISTCGTPTLCVTLFDSCAETEPVSCTPGATLQDVSFEAGDTMEYDISANSRFIPYSVQYSLWTHGDGVYLWDRCFGVASGCSPTRVKISLDVDGNWLMSGWNPSVSSDGRYVTFVDYSSEKLVRFDTAPASEIFMRDTCIGVESDCTPSTARVSLGNVAPNARE